MHRRLLVGDKWRWYFADIAIPLGTAALVAAFCRWAMPADLGVAAAIAALITASGLVFLAALLAAPLVRSQASGQIRKILDSVRSR
jgi:hypothetical protein